MSVTKSGGGGGAKRKLCGRRQSLPAKAHHHRARDHYKTLRKVSGRNTRVACKLVGKTPGSRKEGRVLMPGKLWGGGVGMRTNFKKRNRAKEGEKRVGGGYEGE